MNKEAVLYGMIGLLLGIVVTGAAAGFAVNNQHNGMMRMMGMRTSTNDSGMMSNAEMTMDGMTNLLRGKTGDEFDRTFIEQMISHHQGAIEMAELAKRNAKHDEIKKLADDIIAAQAKEIDMMHSWQSSWGYPSTGGSHAH